MAGPMKQDYHCARGWDAEDRPGPALVARLGLEEYAARLGFYPVAGAGA
jgi:hypothetical protein